MSTSTIAFGFKAVELNDYGRKKHRNEVWIEYNSKKPSRVLISSDIAKEYNLLVGDRLELCESADGKTLALHRVNHSASFAVRRIGNTFSINSGTLAMNICTRTRVSHHIDCKRFHAQVIDDYIVFVPKGDGDVKE